MPSTQDEITTALDLNWIRAQFPSFAQKVNGHPATYFDGPGGTQVPQRVIDAISDYLKHSNANTRRGFSPLPDWPFLPGCTNAGCERRFSIAD